MHSLSKYQANDSQLLTNQEQLESQEEEDNPSSSEEDDGMNYNEEEHYAFWLWEMFNKRD